MKRIIAYFFLCVVIYSCSRLNKAVDLITQPSAREVYQRDYQIPEELFDLWEQQQELAMKDSLEVNLPYAENGHFHSRSFPIYSYNISLHVGEIGEFEVFTDSLNDLIFMDLYQFVDDSIQQFKKVKSSEIDQHFFEVEIKESGKYKLVVQPGIGTETQFVFRFNRKPAYVFPVLGGSNRNIQSYWGASRDGGIRNHEGIDIFAKRGTPVLAATRGRIGFTGSKGLGGKQVWLHDSKRRLSLYYAHLDSIYLTSGYADPGDTLGFVGNTGNAIGTSPHLHFGIYKGYQGAIDPLHFVLQSQNFKPDIEEFKTGSTKLIIKNSIANLRNRPSTSNSEVLGVGKKNDTLEFLGITESWYHVRTRDKKASFIYRNLVAPL